MSSKLNEILNFEECNALLKVLHSKYASFLNGRFFELESHSDKDQVWVCLLLRNHSNQFYYPVEGRMSSDKTFSSKEAALHILDYMDLYFDEYLKDDVLLPIDWGKHHFEGRELELKGQIFDKKKEQLADEWLNRDL